MAPPPAWDIEYHTVCLSTRRRRTRMFPGAHACTTPDKPAIVSATTGATVTYAALDDAANRLSRCFADAGLGPGDHVAFCVSNDEPFLQVLWGAHYAGLYYTAIST